MQLYDQYPKLGSFLAISENVTIFTIFENLANLKTLATLKLCQF